MVDIPYDIPYDTLVIHIHDVSSHILDLRTHVNRLIHVDLTFAIGLGITYGLCLYNMEEIYKQHVLGTLPASPSVRFHGNTIQQQNHPNKDARPVHPRS